MSVTQQTETLTGTPGVPSAPGPAPVPTPRRTFRSIGKTSISTSDRYPTTLYTRSSGLAPLASAFEGLSESDTRDDRFNEFAPCFLFLVPVWFLTCRRLASHDRFLKDTTGWHPYLDLLYLSFMFWYHILRVRRDFGNISNDEHSFLASLEDKYPPSQMHLPGSYVGFFQAISTTLSPYQWQTLIGPALPSNTGFTSNNGFLFQHQFYELLSNPLIALQFVYKILTSRRTSADLDVYQPNTDRTWFGVQLVTASQGRWIMNTPYFIAGNPSSIRAEDAFWLNNSTANRAANANNTPSPALDLPRRPTAGENDHELNFGQILGVVDFDNAQGRYRNWPNMYSGVINLMSQYIAGSRTLNDIPTVGLGASTIVWRLSSHSYIVRNGNLDGADDQQRDAAWTAHIDARLINEVRASAIIRAPELDQSALQIAAGALVNVDTSGIQHAVDNDLLRTGPFWDSAQCAGTGEVDILRAYLSQVPSLVSSTKNQ
jgi:hypothetical protein